MILFHNDYNKMCHPQVLQKISEFMQQQNIGYGMDEHCNNAADLIRKKCDNMEVDVHFLVGGTQANLTVIDAILRPHQGVVCANTGHINVHETGAVEATGHKVIALDSIDGKLSADQIDAFVKSHYTDPDREHTAQPKLVYISNPTELGTIYSLAELTALSDTCHSNGLYLFMDGARLGYGLTAADNDLTLADVARLTDVFYVGGTKCGAMFGEAVVISNSALKQDFRYLIKQHGAMLAKGWMLGLQFEALFENDLYFTICAEANQKADQLRQTLDEHGYSYLVVSNTNQVFPILPDEMLEQLGKAFTFVRQQKMDYAHTAVRFCTSWSTTQAEIDALCSEIRKFAR